MCTNHNQWLFCDFTPGDTFKFENVGPTITSTCTKPNQFETTIVTSIARLANVRRLLVDFQLIPSLSLDFQVALNLGETTPLSYMV